MAAAVESFQHWLDNKLKALNTDENVFGSYIIAILDSDETSEEKTEALQGILSEIVETEACPVAPPVAYEDLSHSELQAAEVITVNDCRLLILIFDSSVGLTLPEMAAAVESFQHWLANKLKDLNTDENVFGSYIIGILDSDETSEEKTEALQGILSEIVETENDIAHVYSEIMEMWLKFKPREAPNIHSAEDVDIKLAKLLESQCLSTTKQKEYTEEEKKIREAILSQYSQMSDEEGEDVETHAATTGDHNQKENNLEKNTNASSVQQAEKEKREQARMDSQRKKEKDKEDREKQKQMREDKKEKRKTQKGERRR